MDHLAPPALHDRDRDLARRQRVERLPRLFPSPVGGKDGLQPAERRRQLRDPDPRPGPAVAAFVQHLRFDRQDLVGAGGRLVAGIDQHARGARRHAHQTQLVRVRLGQRSDAAEAMLYRVGAQEAVVDEAEIRLQEVEILPDGLERGSSAATCRCLLVGAHPARIGCRRVAWWC